MVSWGESAEDRLWSVKKAVPGASFLACANEDGELDCEDSQFARRSTPVGMQGRPLTYTLIIGNES